MKIVMYPILTALFLCCTIGNSFAQEVEIPIDEATKLISYRKVIKTDESKDVMFNKAIGWINGFYANPSSVTKKRDLATGLIEGAARFTLTLTDDKGQEHSQGLVEYKFTLDIKDERYRYTFTEFSWKQQSRFPCERWMDTSATGYKPVYADYLKALDTFMNELTVNLVAKMAEKEIKQTDDW